MSSDAEHENQDPIEEILSQAQDIYARQRKRRRSAAELSSKELRLRLSRPSRGSADLPKPFKCGGGPAACQKNSPAGDGFTEAERGLSECKKRGMKLRTRACRSSEGLQLITDPLLLEKHEPE